MCNTEDRYFNNTGSFTAVGIVCCSSETAGGEGDSGHGTQVLLRSVDNP